MKRKNLKEKAEEIKQLYKVPEEGEPLTEEQKAQNKIWMEKHTPEFIKKNYPQDIDKT